MIDNNVNFERTISLNFLFLINFCYFSRYYFNHKSNDNEPRKLNAKCVCIFFLNMFETNHSFAYYNCIPFNFKIF